MVTEASSADAARATPVATIPLTIMRDQSTGSRIEILAQGHRWDGAWFVGERLRSHVLPPRERATRQPVFAPSGPHSPTPDRGNYQAYGGTGQSPADLIP